MKAVIPAAGLGTRLNPLTNYISKEMFPFTDIDSRYPLIHFAIEEAKKANLNPIIVTSTRKPILNKYLSENYSNIEKVIQNKPRGLGHAIYKTKHLIDSDFAVILPDDLVVKENPIHNMIIHYYFNNFTCLVAGEVIDSSKVEKYGVFNDVSHVSDDIYHTDYIVEKPSKENTPTNMSVIGRYILPKNIFDFIDLNKNDVGLTNAINKLDNINIYEIQGDRYDYGSI